MLHVDGRSGGGQLVRTGLCLSALTRTPVRMEHIRGGRPASGLRPQHLAAVRAVAELCQAEVSNAVVGSKTLTFQPKHLLPNAVEVDIGTAGSITLLFDAVLPFSSVIDTGFTLTATGGTDVKWAPPLDYLARIKLPLLTRVGFIGEVERLRTGYYPAGGGRATIRLEPSTLEALHLDDRGALDRVEIVSRASTELADQEVAERQARRAATRLENEGIAVARPTTEYVESNSPGSTLLLRAVFDGSLAGFDALGERGKPAEAVADEAVDRCIDFLEGEAAVDVHMGDQLLVALAIAGGRIRAPALTAHMESSAELIAEFGFDLEVNRRSDDTVVVESEGSTVRKRC